MAADQGSHDKGGQESTAKSPDQGSVGEGAPAKPARAGRLAVRGDESPWTEKELSVVRAELQADIDRLRAEIDTAEHDLADLLRTPVTARATTRPSGCEDLRAGAGDLGRQQLAGDAAAERAGAVPDR